MTLWSCNPRIWTAGVGTVNLKGLTGHDKVIYHQALSLLLIATFQAVSQLTEKDSTAVESAENYYFYYVVVSLEYSWYKG